MSRLPPEAKEASPRPPGCLGSAPTPTTLLAEPQGWWTPRRGWWARSGPTTGEGLHSLHQKPCLSASGLSLRAERQQGWVKRLGQSLLLLVVLTSLILFTPQSARLSSYVSVGGWVMPPFQQQLSPRHQRGALLGQSILWLTETCQDMQNRGDVCGSVLTGRGHEGAFWDAGI